MDIGQLAESGYAVKKEIEALEEKQKELNEKLKGIKASMIFKLKEMGVNSFKHATCQVIQTTKISVKNPQTPEEKEKFYNYLKEKNIFENMVSVNHMSLNSWYKEEIEAAKAAGNFDFKIPGLGEPTIFEDISFRKA